VDTDGFSAMMHAVRGFVYFHSFVASIADQEFQQHNQNKEEK
jgi:hypothetical protein